MSLRWQRRQGKCIGVDDAGIHRATVERQQKVDGRWLTGWSVTSGDVFTPIVFDTAASEAQAKRLAESAHDRLTDPAKLTLWFGEEGSDRCVVLRDPDHRGGNVFEVASEYVLGLPNAAKLHGTAMIEATRSLVPSVALLAPDAVPADLPERVERTWLRFAIPDKRRDRAPDFVQVSDTDLVYLALLAEPVDLLGED